MHLSAVFLQPLESKALTSALSLYINREPSQMRYSINCRPWMLSPVNWRSFYGFVEPEIRCPTAKQYCATWWYGSTEPFFANHTERINPDLSLSSFWNSPLLFQSRCSFQQLPLCRGLLCDRICRKHKATPSNPNLVQPELPFRHRQQNLRLKACCHKYKSIPLDFLQRDLFAPYSWLHFTTNFKGQELARIVIVCPNLQLFLCIG